MNLNNYKFNYFFRGSPEKPVIVFLHGFMGNCHSFDAAILSLSKDFFCLSIDLPGHGQTQVIGGDQYYTIPKIAHGLVELLNQLKISQCLLTGYSMGGRIALYLTIYFPDHFSQVILESASPGLKTPQERTERLKNDHQLAQELETTEFALFLDKWYDNKLFVLFKNHPDFKRVLEKRLNNNPVELAKALRNCSTGLQPSLWEKIQHNEIPILLLVGELDQKFIAINQEMVNLSQSITIEIIEDCDHNIHFGKVDNFVETIRQFVVSGGVKGCKLDNE
ncbi:MAG TPA: 2-succinyl-6-hydroxy-2,4-cyclohexadiene-1-carboxylate synthase [Cyanothece sp. UBA12306]|nr:2-succinyl-6-hydroxy-2,4-cyclohexadiene-1-carboxylate synthase [Cyanothece sp. UBA12306]